MSLSEISRWLGELLGSRGTTQDPEDRAVGAGGAVGSGHLPVPMERRRIGSLTVSTVGLGCVNFGSRLDVRESAAVVRAALGAGVTFFDVADTYGETAAESFLGRALLGHRDEVIIGTKFGKGVGRSGGGAKPAYVKRACEASLRRLRTDRIDLYQLHQPDPETPIADTLGALNELVSGGKVREIGCSNFSAAQLREARDASGGGAAFASVQTEYNLLHLVPENDTLAEGERLGMAILPYRPLAGGMLTGKYRRGGPNPTRTRLAQGWHPEYLTDAKFDAVERLAEFAKSRGHTVLELAFAWLLSRAAVSSVVAGAMSADQVTANVAASGWRLAAPELLQVDTLARAVGGVPGR